MLVLQFWRTIETCKMQNIIMTRPDEHIYKYSCRICISMINQLLSCTTKEESIYEHPRNLLIIHMQSPRQTFRRPLI
jgi:hypothetical protein